MASGNRRAVVDMDDLMPEGWDAKIHGVVFPIPGDIPVELWLAIQSDTRAATAIDEDSDQDEAEETMRRLYSRVVRVIQLETPGAVPEQTKPWDWNDEDDGEWEPDYPEGAVVIPSMTSIEVGAFVAALFSRVQIPGEDEPAVPPTARPRRASTTRNSKSGSGAGAAGGTAPRRRTTKK